MGVGISASDVLLALQFMTDVRSVAGLAVAIASCPVMSTPQHITLARKLHMHQEIEYRL